ncbi:MAG TPA: class I SAM-dependent methyltransferase [Casimicrobiaceae bacterium]|nr:class I SAM-dependent methyltransferase [Casimicrobiaceae bacterium]
MSGVVEDSAAASLQEAYPGCPLCGGTSVHIGTGDCHRHRLWHEPLPRFIDWMRCESCGHVHTRHYWTDAGLRELFGRAHANQVAGGNLEQRRQLWKPVIAQAVQALGGYASTFSGRHAAPVWLDVGCGNGLVLMLASEFGFDAVGVDRRQQAVDALASLGYRVIQAGFLDVAMDRPAAVISMLDVLEHMPWPARALSHARTLLPVGGCLVLSLPNMESSSWKQLDADNANPYWIEIEHHHNFSFTRLSRLLAEHGFEIALFDIPSRYVASMELYAVRKV